MALCICYNTSLSSTPSLPIASALEAVAILLLIEATELVELSILNKFNNDNLMV